MKSQSRSCAQRSPPFEGLALSLAACSTMFMYQPRTRKRLWAKAVTRTSAQHKEILVLFVSADGCQPDGRGLICRSCPAVQVQQCKVVHALASDLNVDASAVRKERDTVVALGPVAARDDGAAAPSVRRAGGLEDRPGPAEVFKPASLFCRDPCAL